MTDLPIRAETYATEVHARIKHLRNNLAHARDVATHDWPQIARMTQHMEKRLRGDTK